jgi:hypothetical protein
MWSALGLLIPDDHLTRCYSELLPSPIVFSLFFRPVFSSLFWPEEIDAALQVCGQQARPNRLKEKQVFQK